MKPTTSRFSTLFCHQLPIPPQEFPYYYDRCQSCGNTEDNTFIGYVYPTNAERTFRASRTEVYHCSSCGETSRFARYAAVSKVLETRRGRCGEYSVLMLRLLEALGYECRWVVDWSDHVWLEAWIGGRWVHVDPCEVSTCYLLFRSFFDCVGGGGRDAFYLSLCNCTNSPV